MNTPTKIYIGTRNGKDLSVVDENCPNAKEYLSRYAVLGLLCSHRMKAILNGKTERADALWRAICEIDKLN